MLVRVREPFESFVLLVHVGRREDHHRGYIMH